MDNDFKYDVAFSFLNDDERLALAINDLIQDRFSTFIYSQHQDELAGRDGQEMFNEIFGIQSRLVVILYRKGWGETNWTRMEEIAIKNRAYEIGYDFTLWIILDGSKPPQYVPKTRLWYDIERWGNDGAASVIESKINELGGVDKIETSVDIAARADREIQFEVDRRDYLNSTTAVNNAKIFASNLMNELQNTCAEIVKENKNLNLNFVKVTTHECKITGPGSIFLVRWYNNWNNTLRDSELEFYIKEGWARGSERNMEFVIQDTFTLDIDHNFKFLWRSNNQSKVFSNTQMVQNLMSKIMDTVKEFQIQIIRDF